jgi:nodulation protein E
MNVAITGLGCRTASGSTPDEIWASCISGPVHVPERCFKGDFEGSPTVTVPFRSAPPVEPTAFPNAISPHFRRATKNTGLALAAAIDAAGPDFASLRGDERCAVIWGSGSSTIEPIEASYIQVIANGRSRISPLTVPHSMASCPAGVIAMTLGICGPSFATASACASSAHAIGLACQLIEAGTIDRAIVGGSEVLSDFGAILSWHATGVLSKSACRPFHSERDGIVLGEGAAALMIERGDLCLARGARPRAWVDSVHYRTGGSDILAPDPATVSRLVRDAVGVHPNSGGPIVFNAHATGTMVGDSAELAALRAIGQGTAAEVLVSATKPVTGHMLSAAGAIEAMISILALEHRILPCAARVSKSESLDALESIPIPTVDRIFSNSFGFGGMNCVLCFRRD